MAGCIPTSSNADTLNFAPHVTIPFLMINGEYGAGNDFETPLNICQIPCWLLPRAVPGGIGTYLPDYKHRWLTKSASNS